jgi:tetratricopeptide (TPR) repeat protein
MAERLGSVRVQAEALSSLAARMPWPDAERALTRAIDLAETAGLLNQADRAHHNLGFWLSYYLADFRQARHHYLRAAELNRQRGAIGSEWRSRHDAAWVAIEQGDMASAARELNELRESVEMTHQPELLAGDLDETEVFFYLAKGDVPEAIERANVLRAQYREAGNVPGLWFIMPHLVDGLLQLGDESEAEAAVQEAIDLSAQTPSAGWQCICQTAAHLASQGQTEIVRQQLSEVACAMANQQHPAFGDLSLSWAQARLAAAEGRWPEAWEAFRATAEGLSRPGLRCWTARVWRHWAEALLQRGEPGDWGAAQDLLKRAHAKFEAIGAGPYAQQVKEQLEHLAQDKN